MSPRLPARSSERVPRASAWLRSRAPRARLARARVAAGNSPNAVLYCPPKRPKCLTPAGLRNVLVAGRCVSSTHEAQASIRVSAPSMAMGEAAGLAAAMALAAGCDSRSVAVGALQDALRREGAILEPAG